MTTTTATRSINLPSAAVLMGGCYLLAVLGTATIHIAQILSTDVDPYGSEGPVESIVAVSLACTVALALAVGIGFAFRGSRERDQIGAIVLAVLAVPSVIVFWSGAPAVIGAGAVWKAGLTRGGTPLDGAGRVAGLVGLFLLIATLVLLVVGYAFF